MASSDGPQVCTSTPRSQCYGRDASLRSVLASVPGRGLLSSAPARDSFQGGSWDTRHWLEMNTLTQARC